MERFDLTARLWEKPGSSYDTIKRALGKLSGQTLPGRLSRKCRCSGRPCTCGGPEGTLARENGSNPN